MDKQQTILVVDDDSLNLKVLAGLFKTMGHAVVTAESGKQALTHLDGGIDLVVADILMPVMDGFELVTAIREDAHYRDLPVIMATTLDSKSDRLKAVEAGANDFITKPIDKMELQIRTASLLRMKRSQDQVKQYQAELESLVEVRTRALQLAVENLKASQKSTRSAYLETILCLSSAAEYRDDDTASHIHRVSKYAELVAFESGLSKQESEVVQWASPMHDVGKIGVPDAILLKPGPLTADEWAIMKKHTVIGAEILGNSASELLQTAAIIALSHHERWDGSGYPRGLKGESIPLYGRICAIADVFDALTNERPYKEAFSNEKALEIMQQGRGTHFDPALLDVFMNNLDQVFHIQEEYKEADERPLIPELEDI